MGESAVDQDQVIQNYWTTSLNGKRYHYFNNYHRSFNEKEFLFATIWKCHCYNKLSYTDFLCKYLTHIETTLLF